MDPKASNPATDAEGFTIVPTTEPEEKKVKQTNNPKEAQAQSQQSPNKTPSGSRKSVHWSPELVDRSPVVHHCATMSILNGSNPYISSAPAQESSSASFKDTMDTVKDLLGRWTRKVGEASRKAEDLAGNTWQHLRTSRSFAEAAMGRIAQGTKILAEGGYEKIFRQTFETVPEEQLLDSFACYLSTSAGPVMGVLYVSTVKLAYCSDSPLSYKNGSQTEWSYYKVCILYIISIPLCVKLFGFRFMVSDITFSCLLERVIMPLHQLKAVNPSTSRINPSEKYIQGISIDGHEFWFKGFLDYDGAVKYLQDALQLHSFLSV